MPKTCSGSSIWPRPHLHLAVLNDDRLNRLRIAAQILRRLKSAGKLTGPQESLLAAVEAMTAQAQVN